MPFRASFSGQSISMLGSTIDTSLASQTSIGHRVAHGPSEILGVFTGQGAQWASMGRELVLSSQVARKSLEVLEESLAGLPAEDRPSWSLSDEIMANEKASNIHNALVSQPLCTAIQIILVDVLYAFGVKFAAVVGHSSGDIAAAYASGFLCAADAIRIAYYRGLYAGLASGVHEEKGAMLALGAMFSEAKDFCESPTMKGRIHIAASNSPTSITLSGDFQAVEEARVFFVEQKKFARLLKVDTAYHSHHMLRCQDAYLTSLRKCHIQLQNRSNSSCVWYSSVSSGRRIDSPVEELKDSYWVDSMVKPVLFSQAVEGVMSDPVAVSLVLEIGPHPALKQPALDAIDKIRGPGTPYSATLIRGQNDASAVAEALGFVWTFAGDKAVDLYRAYDYYPLYGPADRPHLLKGLPRFSWDHQRSFWSESRATSNFLLR
jgi:hybrid polyketide synthase/nonribosomal peptide synthetase ACE1